LAPGQADRLPGCFQHRMRVASLERVEDGRVREGDGIPGARRREPPPVEDHERDRRHATVLAAARQIASKAVGSSEAPPTRAPTTSGCATSEAAFSGLTDPP